MKPLPEVTANEHAERRNTKFLILFKFFLIQTQETKLKLCSSFSELSCHNQLCQTTNLKDAGNIL